MKVLLVGVGEVGRKHLAVLRRLPEATVVGLVDPVAVASDPVADASVPLYQRHAQALAATTPDVVIVATPPGVCLEVARMAAATGATVLVEKPVVVSARDLDPQPGDERIYVGFHTHFAPGVAELLTTHDGPAVVAAAVRLAWRRDHPYYRGWRARHATAGGVLHQQAIHGLALALRLWPASPVEWVSAATFTRRRWKEVEDEVQAHLTLAGGQELTIGACVDATSPASHTVTLTRADGTVARVEGRNLEAGVHPRPATTGAGVPCSDADLRAALHRALFTAHQCGDIHPSLYPLSELRRPLEVIDRVYAAAHQL